MDFNVATNTIEKEAVAVETCDEEETLKDADRVRFR